MGKMSKRAGSRNYLPEDVRIGRLIRRDDDSVILEIPRRMDKELELKEGDEFFTLIFTQIDPWGNKSGRDSKAGPN